jgi:hypothetical protein
MFQWIKICAMFLSFFFLSAFILCNNEAMVYYCNLWHAVFHVLRGPRSQDVGTPSLLLLEFFYPTIQCNYIACNVPPDAGLQKRASFSALMVGLAGTGDRTRAGWAACSLGLLKFLFLRHPAARCMHRSSIEDRVYWQIMFCLSFQSLCFCWSFPKSETRSLYIICFVILLLGNGRRQEVGIYEKSSATLRSVCPKNQIFTLLKYSIVLYWNIMRNWK